MRRLLAAAAALILTTPALAQSACPDGKLRPVNVGVAVTPPNVMHSTPIVAKDLGLFAKHCLDATITTLEGAGSATAMVAVAQGRMIGTISDAAIAQGVKARQIFMYAPRLAQIYVVNGSVKTVADLKGKRLSASGGGVGGLNWRMARALMATAGLKPEDAHFISQGTAGRLPGLLTGQLDGVALHPEDVFTGRQKRADLHVLSVLGDLMPLMPSGAYGAAESLIARDRSIVVDTVAALIEANRALYRDRDKVLPILVKATLQPPDAVAYAWNELTKACIWAVNAGFTRERVEWAVNHSIENGDIVKEKRPTYEQIVDDSIPTAALAKLGGPVEIGNCNL